MSRKKLPVGKRFLDAVLVIFLVVFFLPIWLPLILVGVFLILLYKSLLYVMIWLVWLPRGKDVLFVYSDSPIWRDYMLEQILPIVHERSVVLNWSERKLWPRWSLGVRAFHHFGGSRAYNPLVIVFRLLRPANRVRFWAAFQEWKRGSTESVEALRQELVRLL